MNTFNRVLLIVLLAGLAVISIAVIFFAWVSPESALDVLDNSIDWLDDNQGTLEKTLVSSGAGLVALLAMTLLYLELVPPAGSDVGITDLKGGSATLSTEAVAQRIEDSIARVPFVSDAKVRVDGRRKGVSVALDVNVDPQANLAQVTDEVCDVVRDVLANRVHVALIDAPTVRLHYREPRAGRQPARRPAINAAPVRGELPEAVQPPVDERAPALVGPRRALGAQQEPDVPPFNGAPANGSPTDDPGFNPGYPTGPRTAPATPAGTSGPPVSPRPVGEREVWAPEPQRPAEPTYTRPESPPPLHHPAPLYSRPDLERPAPRPEPVDEYRARPSEQGRPDPSAPSAYARPQYEATRQNPEPPYARPAYDAPSLRPEASYSAPPATPPPSTPPAQSKWAPTAYTEDEEPPMREDAPRDETPGPDDYRLRPTDPYRGNV